MSNNDEYGKFYSNCKANGCPLESDYVTRYWKPRKRGERRLPRCGVCRYHKASPPEGWTVTTNFIRRHLELITIVQGVERIKSPQFKPMPGERVVEWQARCEELLRLMILEPEKPSHIDADLMFNVMRSSIEGAGDS